MKKCTAVICECNPLHLGHEYIFANAKKDSECVIAVMSGNFVQRAENALFDKYARAEALCRCGADLVVELPFPWSAASAEYFASAGVALAGALGASRLVFGASQKDGLRFMQIAEYLEQSCEPLKCSYRTEVSLGAAQVREDYLTKKFGDSVREFLRCPNDILAIEYCKAILRQKLSLDICAVPRISGAENPLFRSATVLRSAFYESSLSEIRPHIPASAYEVFERSETEHRYAAADRLAELAFWRLRMNLCSAFSTADGTGGVLTRLQSCAQKARNGAEMYALAATKKYTNARFRRAALFYLLDVFPEDISSLPLFTVVLAASKTGCAYLAELRKEASIGIVTKPSDAAKLEEPAQKQYGKLCYADRLYTLCMRDVMPSDYFIKKSPWIER